MRRLTIHFAIALLTFTIGVLSGAFWYAKRNQSVKQQAEVAQAAPKSEDQEWPLSPELVARALQTRVISTKRLRRNGDDEIVWRWLKQSIADYPQNFVKLNISEAEHYSVVLYRPTILSANQLAQINIQLKEQGRPLLEAGKKYAELQVNQGNIACPDWYGLIDLDEAKLKYFQGRSA
jgi:hypothetical protein